MAKKNNDYFKLIEQQVSYCMEASALLEEIVGKFSVDSINAYRDQMREIEHAADLLHHDIINKVSTEFITPLDQEDIIRLAQVMDDIADVLEDVIKEFYMYHMDRVPRRAAELIKIVNRCVSALHETVCELKNFKKPAKLLELVIKVKEIETEVNEAYTEAIRGLFVDTIDIKTLMGRKAIYESLERTGDLCEHAVEVIELVVIKNT